MSRLKRPLNRKALREADDAFYTAHPELVKNGKRVPLSANTPGQATLRQEWVELYKEKGGEVEEQQSNAPAEKHDDPIGRCDTEEKNWIELEYRYKDDTGVVARYTVINAEDRTTVTQGVLDENGYAWVALPNSVTDVSYDFSNDPETIEYLQQPTKNPEQVKVKEGWAERIASGIKSTGSWIWGTVQGDFNEDQTIGQIATNTAITMIPVVDQVGDVRDIVANLKLLVWNKRYNDKWIWIALVITLIGLIPVLGSAAKGVLKVVVKGLKTSGKIPLDLLIRVLNKFHKGHAVKWLRKLAVELPSHAVTVKKRRSTEF